MASRCHAVHVVARTNQRPRLAHLVYARAFRLVPILKLLRAKSIYPSRIKNAFGDNNVSYRNYRPPQFTCHTCLFLHKCPSSTFCQAAISLCSRLPSSLFYFRYSKLTIQQLMITVNFAFPGRLKWVWQVFVPSGLLATLRGMLSSFVPPVAVFGMKSHPRSLFSIERINLRR